MKTIIAVLTVFIVVLASILFLLREDEVNASIEVIRDSKCGHVQFRLTNHGRDLELGGYEFDSPYFEIEHIAGGKSETFIEECCVGLITFGLKTGESIIFPANYRKMTTNWRIKVEVIAVNNKPAWFNKALQYLRIYKEEPVTYIYSPVIELLPDTNDLSHCVHVEPAMSITE